MITIHDRETGEEVDMYAKNLYIQDDDIYFIKFYEYTDMHDFEDKSDKYEIRVNGMRTREEIEKRIKKLENILITHSNNREGVFIQEKIGLLKWVLGDE